MEQKVISDNDAIFQAITAELESAQTEILVATSWFTDYELFQRLLAKRKDGVKVEVIIGDNQENSKLDFTLLSELGGSVVRIKNVGYGIMHQKFCVVDRKIAIHGSYNWSVNARTNNHESVILTDHADTVATLVKTFFEIKDRAAAILNGVSYERPAKEGLDNQTLIKPTQFSIADPTQEFSKVLDSMIASEVSHFDRGMLKKQGYERSQENDGNAQVLMKALDSVYAAFINDINVVEDKKKRLISKIEEQKGKTIESFREQTELYLKKLDTEAQISMVAASKEIDRITLEQVKIKKEIEVIETISIPTLEEKDSFLKKEISDLSIANAKPAFKIYELIPLLLLFVSLLTYVFFFYSSAAYILIFSERDAIAASLQNVKLPPPEVFNADALSIVSKKGLVATFFVIFFVSIPASFSFVPFSKNKIISYSISIFLGAIVVDSFIAYKVASSIHEIKYLQGDVDSHWQLPMIVDESNFYLVFICGAFGLILLKVLYERLKETLDERSPDFIARSNGVRIKEKQHELEYNRSKRNEFLESRILRQQSLQQFISEIQRIEQDLVVTPIAKANAESKSKKELIESIQRIESLTLIYKSHIENDNLPISIDLIKDRINVFIEGWNDSLYDEFAAPKAQRRCEDAVQVVNVWLSEKLKATLDNRIKHLN
jgi:hypothetical protein